MRVRYIGESDPLALIHGKTYEVLEVDGPWYRIIDETNEDYLYNHRVFEIIDIEEHQSAHRPGAASAMPAITPAPTERT